MVDFFAFYAILYTKEDFAMTKKITLEILLSDEVCRLLDSFAATMNIQVLFCSRTGEVLRRGRNFGNSRYCTLMQDKVFGIHRCIKLDNAMQQLCCQQEKAILYKCHAGLYELIAPVKVLGEVAGFIMFGQFRSDKEIPDFAADDEEISGAFMELPFFDVEATGSLEALINMLINYIVDKELISYSGSWKMQRLQYFISENFTRKVTLHQAAKFLHISDSSLTHFLKDNYQTTFKQLLIEKRLSHAEKLWHDDPGMSVAEAAQLAGCDDPHYFSRLYRKVRGRTAKSFIAELQQKQ